MKVFLKHQSKFFLVFFLLYFSSCVTQKEETEVEFLQRINQKVEEQLADRKKFRLNECQSEALDRAEQLVDSLLLFEAKQTETDSILKPDKPIKPNSPSLLTPNDSNEIKPLFEEIPDTLE